MRRRDFLWQAPLALSPLAFFTGCPNKNAGDPWAGAGTRPKILVSFAALHSLASNVAGEDASVKCLLTTTGPHTHGDATAEQIKLAHGCDLLVINGLLMEDGADGFVNRLEKSAANPKWRVLNVGSKLNEDWLREGVCHHDHSKPGEDHDHGIDPHAWLSVRCAKKMVESIRDELKILDPGHAEGYESRATAYLKKLDKLEADGKAMLAPKEEKRILSFHESLGYFGETYGLKIAGSIQVDPGREPSNDTLQKIIKNCQRRKIRVIAVEPQFPSHTSAQVILNALRGLKEDPIDAVFAEVDPLETCDEAELGPDLYERVMRKNLAELAKVLR